MIWFCRTGTMLGHQILIGGPDFTPEVTQFSPRLKSGPRQTDPGPRPLIQMNTPNPAWPDLLLCVIKLWQIYLHTNSDLWEKNIILFTNMVRKS